MAHRRIWTTTLTLMCLTWAGMVALSGTRPLGSVPSAAPRYVQGSPAVPLQYGTEEDYGYGTRLSDVQRAGRDTWYFWTGGNQKFWVKMAQLTEGNVNLLAYVDSRLHGRRFATLGAITQPGCRPATGPDKYGLWMDVCDQPPVPGIEGMAISYLRCPT